MIPLRFFRDKTHVYINNPDGTTKKMTIADFEAMLDGSGGGGGGGGGDSEGILKVITRQNPDTGYSYLDKSFSEISSAMADGKIVVVYEAVLDDDDVVYASSGIVGVAEIREDTIVDVLYVGDECLLITRYAEDDGVLVYADQFQIPPNMYEAISLLANTLYASGPTLYDSLTHRYCYFFDVGAGANNAYCYTAKEFGHTGSTYYVVLSNGDRYEGGTTGNMTKVTVTP